MRRDIANHGKMTNELASASRQSKTMRFFRGMGEIGKFAVKHPIMTATLIATAVGAITTDKATAQEKDGLAKKPTLTLAVSGLKDDGRAKMKVPVETENYKTMELRDGYLSCGDKTVDVRDELKTLTGKAELSEYDATKKIPVQVEGLGQGAYYIFENAILAVFDREGTTKISVGGVFAKDKIFTHEGGIFVANDGSIIATSSTTLLVMTLNKNIVVEYEDVFGKIPPFKHPQISQGRNTSEVFIRDETMSNGITTARLEIDLKTLKFKVADDKLALGSNY